MENTNLYKHVNETNIQSTTGENNMNTLTVDTLRQAIEKTEFYSGAYTTEVFNKNIETFVEQDYVFLFEPITFDDGFRSIDVNILSHYDSETNTVTQEVPSSIFMFVKAINIDCEISSTQLRDGTYSIRIMWYRCQKERNFMSSMTKEHLYNYGPYLNDEF